MVVDGNSWYINAYQTESNIGIWYQTRISQELDVGLIWFNRLVLWHCGKDIAFGWGSGIYCLIAPTCPTSHSEWRLIFLRRAGTTNSPENGLLICLLSTYSIYSILYHIPAYYIILLHVSCLNTINFFQWTPPTDILSDIFILWHSIWHNVWQSFCHSIWHSTWHSIWHSIGHSFIFFLAFYLTYILTFYLAFFLASYFACIFDSLFGILFGSPSGMLSDILSGMCSGPRPAPLYPELAIEFGPVRALTVLRLAMSFWHLL